MRYRRPPVHIPDSTSASISMLSALPAALLAVLPAAIPAVLVAALLAVRPLAAQDLGTRIVPLPQAPRAADNDTLSRFQVKSGTLQDLVSLPTRNVVSFKIQVLLGDRLCQLELHKHEVRAPGFRLIVHDQDGSRIVQPPPCVTYRGEVAGDAGSMVSASLQGGRLTAVIRLAGGETCWGIQPVTGSGNTINRFTHISYDSAHNVLGNHTCGVEDDEVREKPARTYGPLSNKVWICDLACDADYDFYRQNGGSVTATQNDITTVVNNVGAIYKRDVSIDYKITQIIVRTSRVYNSSQASVSEFRSRWLYFHWNVSRDLAHLFTGRSLGGSLIGVAYMASVCSTNSGYGVSKSRYTGNITARTALTAHEIGHGWSSPHCNNQNPCNIMCSAIGGCSRGLTSFGSYAKAYIVSHRNSRSCLNIVDTAPVLSSISPSVVQAFPPANVTLTGTGFTNVTKVNVGGQALPPGLFKIVSDTMMTFRTPVPPSLLRTAVSAEINGSRSNSLPLSWVATNPPRLVAYSTVKPEGSMLWQYGAAPGDLWFLTLAASGTTTSVLGHTWLSNPILVAAGRLDGAGLGTQGATVPSDAMLGLKVYSQVVTFDANHGVLAGNTNVTLTTTVK